VTQIQQRCLQELVTESARLVRPGYMGTLLWENPCRRQTQHFARPAGRVLNSLKALGYVEHAHVGDDFGWRITWRGRQALARAAVPAREEPKTDGK
jgi:hypothetical protein